MQIVLVSTYIDENAWYEHKFKVIHTTTSAMGLINGWVSGSVLTIYIGGNDASTVLGFASQPFKTGVIYSF